MLPNDDAADELSPILNVAQDPVCGTEVNPIHPPAQSERDGRIFCFCSEECQRCFERDSDRYVTVAEDAPARTSKTARSKP